MIFPLRLVPCILLAMSTTALAGVDVFYRASPSIVERPDLDEDGGPAPSFSASSVSDTVVDVGVPFVVRLGSYAGPTGGWTCSGIPAESNLSCRFSAGVLDLVGMFPSAGRRDLDLRIGNGSASFPMSFAVQARATASFVASSTPVVVDGTERVPLDVRLGRVEGGTNWTCGPVPGLPWATCSVEGGGAVRLTGTPPFVESDVFHAPVRDGGTLVANVEMQVAVTAGAVSFAPHSPPNATRLVTRGEPFAVLLGTYTGGEADWSCIPQTGSLASGYSCAGEKGRLVLRGAEGAATYRTSFRPTRNGSVYGNFGSWRDIYVVAREVTGGPETPLSPRAATFSPIPAVERIFAPGEAIDYGVGAFTGGVEGVSCASILTDSLFPGLACHAVDGQVRLRGVVEGAARRYVRIDVAKDGVVLGNVGLHHLTIRGKNVTGGPETSAFPREGAFTRVANRDRVYQPGQWLDRDLGSFTGGPEGVSCHSSSNTALYPGLACHVVDGRMRLQGQLPTSGTNQTNVTVVKDSMVRGESGLHQMDIRARVVTGGDETPDSPRVATFAGVGPTTVTFKREPGTEMDLDIGAFTGGPEGVSCYLNPTQRLHSGLACHVVDGRVRLRGEPTETGRRSGSIYVVKDGVRLTNTGWMDITVN